MQPAPIFACLSIYIVISFAESRPIKMLQAVAIATAAVASVAYAQDPAPGWMAYAKAELPEGAIINTMSMKWRNLDNPSKGGAFYSPWYGMDPSDNLNLIQPVNPWLGSSWVIYCEYFQWSPEHNVNTDQVPTKPGDLIHGTITYNGDSASSYTMKNENVATGQTTQAVIPIQNGPDGKPKKFDLPYIVFEKVWPCEYYPPNDAVTFFDIDVSIKMPDGSIQKNFQPQWSSHVMDANCGMKAVVHNATAVSITWDSSGNTPAHPKAVAPELLSADAPNFRLGAGM